MSAPPNAENLGGIHMITFITPIKPLLTTLWLRPLFFLTRPFPRFTQIKPLKFVHFTCWSLLTSIPYNGRGQLRERPVRPYMVWSSVYNGEVDPYIEAFVAHVSKQIFLTWGPSYGYPGTKSVSDLRRYIVDASWPGSFAYSAYPDATVRMIEAAMTIRTEHRLLETVADADDPTEFERVYEGFLTRSGNLL